MDIKSLVRDAGKVQAYLQELPDSRLITTKGCKIIIPARYTERGLAEVGIDTYIVGIYAMIVDDKYYAVSLVNAMIRIEPTSYIKIKIDEIDHLEFYFEPGSTVMSSVNLVKKDTLIYSIFDEILSKGKVPWFMTYDDMGHIYDTANYHSGANIGTDSEVTELIVSLIARDSKNRSKYYRNTIKSLADIKDNPPTFIPLRSVEYGATNTTNKLAGSYFSSGVVSALVTPTDRVEKIEKILRE